MIKRELVAALGLAAVLCGCSSKPESLEDRAMSWSEKTAATTQEVIEDPDRAAKAKDITAKLHDEVVGFYDTVRAAQQDAVKLNTDYDADRAQFEAIIERLQADRGERSERMIALAINVRSTMTAEEWKEFADRTPPLTADN